MGRLIFGNKLLPRGWETMNSEPLLFNMIAKMPLILPADEEDLRPRLSHYFG
jgi:hypothetical protein